MYPEDMFSIEDEPWLNKAVDSVKKPTAHAPIPKVQVEDPEGFPESTIGLDQAALEPSQAGMAESIEKKEGITCGGSQDGVYAVGAHYRLNNEDLPLLRRITSPIWTNLNYRESREVAGRLGADGYIRVRFAVRPDGSYFPPETTHSSGSAEDDELILSAIRRVDVFPHLPPDKTLPLVLCLSFYKNHKAQELQIGRSKKAAVKEPEE
jgi:TonB family protein